MRRFKVKALSVGGHNNKIFKSGQEVTSKNFPSDNLDRLVKEGFLEEIEPTEADLNEDENEIEKEPLVEVPTLKQMDDFTEDQLKEWLKSKEIFFRKKAEKPELYGLYLKEMKNTTGQ